MIQQQANLLKPRNQQDQSIPRSSSLIFQNQRLLFLSLSLLLQQYFPFFLLFSFQSLTLFFCKILFFILSFSTKNLNPLSRLLNVFSYIKIPFNLSQNPQRSLLLLSFPSSPYQNIFFPQITLYLFFFSKIPTFSHAAATQKSSFSSFPMQQPFENSNPSSFPILSLLFSFFTFQILVDHA